MAITLLAWQPLELTPAPGLDPSWQAALSMAVHQGVPFGNHLIFSYGPLGFLPESTVWYHGLGALSFAYAFATRFALALGLFVVTRTTFGSVVAFVVAVVVAGAVPDAVEVVILLIALVWATTTELPRRRALAVAALAGGFAGVELLMKISTGVTLTALTVVFVLCAPARKRELASVAALMLVAALLLGWIASGQPLASLPDYVKQSEQVVSGYSAAMSVAPGGFAWQATAALLALAFGIWGALHMTDRLDVSQRRGVVLLWIVFWFFAFKEGFVRHDIGHAARFFEAVLGGFFAFWWRPTHRLPALACGGALLAFSLAATGQSITSELNPTRNVRAAQGDARDAVISSRSRRVMAEGRAAIRVAEPLDAATLALLGGQSVAPYPTDIALAWAYGLKWDPLPVIQSYQAYTAELDRTNASFLASAGAPQRILWELEPGIDGRILAFDEPFTNRAILCRYALLHATKRFAVLGRSTNRCAGTAALGTIHADWGQSVPVPQPSANSLVYVRINGAGVSGLESLRALFFKPAYRYVVLNRGKPFRLVENTAPDGLPVRAAPGLDYPLPFNVAVGARTIAVLKQGQGPTGGRPITFSFYEQAFSAAAQARR